MTTSIIKHDHHESWWHYDNHNPNGIPTNIYDFAIVNSGRWRKNVLSSSAQLWLDQRRNWQPTKINIRSNVVWQEDTISNNNGGGLHPGAPDCQCHVASPGISLALVIRLFAMALDEASLRRYLDEAATRPHDSP